MNMSMVYDLPTEQSNIAEDEEETDYSILKFRHQSSTKSSTKTKTSTQDENVSDGALKKTRRKRADKFTWTDEATFTLIDKWQAEACLYDVHHENYSDKQQRNIAIKRIQTGIKEKDIVPVPSTEEILAKMNGLRTYHNAQRQKVRASQTSGKGSSEVYQPSWIFFEELHFLDSASEPRPTVSTLLPPDNTIPPYNSATTKRLRKDRQDTPSPNAIAINKASDALSSLVSSRNEPKSDDMHFGETLGRLLSKVKEGQRKDILKLELQRLIISATYDTPSPGSSAPMLSPLGSPPMGSPPPGYFNQ